jgi:hypothetical protein
MRKTFGVMTTKAIVRTLERIHRYMSHNEIYSHGVMRSLTGKIRTDGGAITSSKLMTKLIKTLSK